MKRRTMKRLFTLVLTLAMLCSTVLPASAADISTEPMETIQTVLNSDQSNLTEALSAVENCREDFGIDDSVDFSKIVVGNAIHAYELLLTGFEELRIIYPLFYQNELIAVAIRTPGGHFQIETYLSEYLKDYSREDISIVYDKNACYVYNGTTFTLLYDNFESCDWRAELKTNNDLPTDVSNITLTTLIPSVTLAYERNEISSYSTRSDLRIAVDFLTQQPHNKICWAATIAMIKNHISNTNLTPQTVATALHGTNFNSGATIAEARTVMNSTYSMGFVQYSSTPAIARLMNNLGSNYPMYGQWNYVSGNGAHSMVICGVKSDASYLYTKDPWLSNDNSTLCPLENGKYVYTNVNGATANLAYTLSKYS